MTAGSNPSIKRNWVVKNKPAGSSLTNLISFSVFPHIHPHIGPEPLGVPVAPLFLITVIVIFILVLPLPMIAGIAFPPLLAVSPAIIGMVMDPVPDLLDHLLAVKTAILLIIKRPVPNHSHVVSLMHIQNIPKL